jgi:ABC-type nitrate/sulfonate/bicarbonate transport system substrate-binding protein
MLSIRLSTCLAVLAAALAAPAAAQDLTTVRVNTFPSASYAPLWIGMEKGLFAKRGIRVDLQFTPNSDLQREGLAKGAFEIAHAAVDNAVAMVETAREDAVIVTGGDNGMNEFIVRPEINSVADIRGKALVVDAPNTAYGLLARKILKNAGLVDGRDYVLKPVGGTPLRLAALQESPQNAAAMLNPPYSFAAKDKGLKSLGNAVELLGPYQAGGVFVMRKWAKANGALLERYIAALIESGRVARDPANRAEVVSLIAARLKQDPKVAERTYETIMGPHGIARDAKFDMQGFRNVLALRAEIEGDWGGRAPAPDKYVDLSYYDRALNLVGGK